MSESHMEQWTTLRPVLGEVDETHKLKCHEFSLLWETQVIAKEQNGGQTVILFGLEGGREMGGEEKKGEWRRELGYVAYMYQLLLRSVKTVYCKLNNETYFLMKIKIKPGKNIYLSLKEFTL